MHNNYINVFFIFHTEVITIYLFNHTNIIVLSFYFLTGDYKTAVKLCLKPDIATWHITRALLAYSYSCLRKHREAMEIARSLIEVGTTLISFKVMLLLPFFILF